MNTSPNANPASDPQSKPSAFRSPAWRRGAIAVSLVAGFMAGAVSLASAGGMPFASDHHGPQIGMIQHFIRGALENVGASTAQEDKIHDIVAATYTDLDQDPNQREELHKKVLELIRAPTIDRAAVEKLRADQIAAIDLKSKKIVGAVLDAANQLTPEQRVKLVQRAEDRMEHGGWGGGHHRGPMDDHGGPGPEGRPDQGPGEHERHG